MTVASLLLIVHPFARRADPPADVERVTETTRETVDQLVYSFLLLIVARAFLIEPFVIPTGSMAPTLYGRHKECTCTACGLDYQIGASTEVDKTSVRLLPDTRISLAACPNCRFPNDVTTSPAFNGDHIVVNKWAFRLGEPARWDVFVFKFPQRPAENYIKRLIGLPDETLRLRGGDVYRVTDSREQIVRKDSPRKRRAASVLVHDSEYVSRPLEEAGWPRRWAGDRWTPGEGGTFVLDGASEQPAPLVYSHIPPSGRDWAAILDGRPVTPTPRLVTDFCPYNSYTFDEKSNFSGETGPPDYSKIDQGIFWVPDLAVELDLTLRDVGGSAAVDLELVEGVHRWRCRIDATAGTAALSRVNVQLDAEEERPIAEAPVNVSGAGTYRLRFANIDDELSLWVDGAAVDFGDAARIERDRLENTLPTRADLRPVSIAVSGAAAVVDRLSLRRDIYYRVGHERGGYMPGDAGAFRQDLIDAVTRPDDYARVLAGADEALLSQTLVTGPDEFIALGDNSPQSNDSRMWSAGDETVPARNLVGKAFYTYWPHGVPFLNGGRGFALRHHYRPSPDTPGRWEAVTDYPRYSVPFYPNFERMGRIR